MPGCSGEAPEGRRLCDYCRGVNGRPLTGVRSAEEIQRDIINRRAEVDPGAALELRKSPNWAKYKATPGIDAEIRKIYAHPGNGATIQSLAEKIGAPRWWVSKRAVVLGCVKPRKNEPRWTEEETAALMEYAHLGLDQIRRNLADRGYKRSVSSIRNRLRRAGGRREFLAAAGYYNAWTLAKALGVDHNTAVRAIRKSGEKIKRRGTFRVEKQGGDEYLISEEWVRKYLKENFHVVDWRKIDKEWLVGLL